jgi:hypothetical protein
VLEVSLLKYPVYRNLGTENRLCVRTIVCLSFQYLVILEDVYKLFVPHGVVLTTAT